MTQKLHIVGGGIAGIQASLDVAAESGAYTQVQTASLNGVLADRRGGRRAVRGCLRRFAVPPLRARGFVVGRRGVGMR